MKVKSLILIAAVAATLTGIAVIGRQTQPAGSRMAEAANNFLASLTPAQKTKATFAFDDKERFSWYFVPKQDKNRKATRKGLPLEDMTAQQKKLALKLLAAGTSKTGNAKALAIMALESVLKKIDKGRSVRNSEWYFFAIFGTPSNTGNWGWRVEGHHLSLNYTVHGGKVVSATPSFFGANPAIIKGKEFKGIPLETLPASENLGRQLFHSLDDKQQKIALQDKGFPETNQGTKQPKAGEPVGLAMSEMNGKQQKQLLRLIQSYANRMPPAIGQAQMKQVRDSGKKIHFAWTGGTKTGQPHTYRIHGATFIIEFLNEQPDPNGTPANHIHSSWRRIGGDFGFGAE